MGLELSDATLSCRKSLARGVRVLAAGLPFFFFFSFLFLQKELSEDLF